MSASDPLQTFDHLLASRSDWGGRMRVYLPKPLHGWREFAGEVGIIVLGVLIALGFGQIVEGWQWQEELRSTRKALSNELVVAADQGAERIAVEDCLRDRIGELASRLNSTTGTWTADPLPLPGGAERYPHWDNRAMGRVYSVPLRGWSQDAWDTAKSTGVLNHMSRQEIADYSAVYGEVTAIRDLQNEELPLETKLAFLSVDQRLDNSTRADALGTIGQLDALNAVIAGLSSLIIDQIKGLHLGVDRAATSKAMEFIIRSERQDRGTCVKDVRVQF
jgi:hypothetical protein